MATTEARASLDPTVRDVYKERNVAGSNRQPAGLQRALLPDAQYTLTDLDTGRTQRLSNRQLMQDGLLIVAPQRPQAAVILYQKVR